MKDYIEILKNDDTPIILDDDLFLLKFKNYVKLRFDKTLYEKYTYFKLSVFEDTL